MDNELNEILNDASEDLAAVLEEYIGVMVESHVEGWKDRYYRKSVDDISYDLNVNHDPSLEYEFVEDKLGRELEDGEHEIVESYFNESVLNEFR